MTGKNIDCSELLSGPVIVIFVAAFGLLLTLAPLAMAHKVYLYAWVEGDMVYTESYFGSKKKVRGGLIQVFDSSGKRLLEGRTNELGEFAFKSPRKTDLLIVVEAGMGHRNEYNLKAEEFSDVLDGKIEPVKTDLAAGKQPEMGSPSHMSLDARQIRLIVEQVLDSRLAPIQRELARARKQEGPGLTEVIGGIGYIFGLMGLILYFRGRKDR
ncbi:MAG: hypothetical protein SV775_15850 [Thermodesulfobacteriota bacterium]|nr:hypothetical protein [Thermodesulfobacteriota bacterium]